MCLLTNDVRRLADFYKRLLGTDNGSDDETHQFIITEETALAIYNDGTAKIIYASRFPSGIFMKSMKK